MILHFYRLHPYIVRATATAAALVLSCGTATALPPPVKSPGLSPQEAVKAMALPDGFRATLFAGEPDVHQPIAFTIDERGRLWVVENYSYPIWSPHGRDRVVIFEDTDGDGIHDRKTVFHDQLNFATAIAVGMGGVWIGTAPYLLFIPDRDRNDQPDGAPQVMLDGWGYKDTHETLNSLVWGPDGWLYGNQGIFTASVVQSPLRRGDPPVALNACVWRFHPTTHRFELFAEGISNQWGLDFNDYGHAFATACVIPHFWHVIQGGHYRRQAGNDPNPYVYELLDTSGDHVHWQGPRNKDWKSDHGSAGGGHAHAGATFYLADSFPAEFRGTLLMHNLLGNRINVDLPVAKGSGYSGTHRPDLMIANDGWFRGLRLEVGPDGSVYNCDWYDQKACHPEGPSDARNGRLYKFSYGEPKPVSVNLATSTSLELVQYQLHANDWYVRRARTLLQERGPDPAVHEALTRILRGNPDVTRQLRALWALHVSGGLSEPLALELLQQSREEHVRAWTIQLMCEDRKPSSSLRRVFAGLAASDPSPVVRLYLASAARRIPVDQRWPIVQGLVAHDEDAGDHNLPLMIWYAAEPLVVADPEKAVKLAEKARIPQLREFITRRQAALMMEPESPRTPSSTLARASLFETFKRTTDAAMQRDILDGLIAANEGTTGAAAPTGWSEVYRKAINDPALAGKATQLAVRFGDASVIDAKAAELMNERATSEARLAALSALRHSFDPKLAPLFQQSLSDSTLRTEALRGLGNFDDARTPAVLLSMWSKLTPDEKRLALNVLGSRPAYARELLAAAQAGTVPRRDLTNAYLRQLRQLKDSDVTKAVGALTGVVRDSPAAIAQEIAEWKRKLTPARLASGDPSRGRVIFEQSCKSCHSLFGEGGEIGPEITGSNRADLDYILLSICDPNAAIGDDYLLTTVKTKDNRVFTGMIREGADTIDIVNPGETTTLQRSIVSDTERLNVSLMPPGLLSGKSAEEASDLLAYFRSKTQVPLPE